MSKISNSQQVPVKVVGGSTFGIYPKISAEKTYNMYISDGWLVNYPGFKKNTFVGNNSTGRGFFNSVRGNFRIAVIGSGVYRVDDVGAPQKISGNLSTTRGKVSIAENLSDQICIVDGESAYIYDYRNSKQLTKQDSVNFNPSYVSYHNTFFLIGSSFTSTDPQQWYTYVLDGSDHTRIKKNTTHALETKPDIALAAIRLPGKGNHIMVFGESVSELWTNVGGTENYRRNASFNIDTGLVSTATLAASENIVCWIGKNENNSPALWVSDGSSAKRISTDGIDGLLENIKRPEQSTGFFYRQNGHLFYQFTFYYEEDNITLIHDFNESKFYHISDEYLNYHPANDIIYHNNKSFFVSLNDDGIYQMGSEFIDYNYSTDSTQRGESIPRIRQCNTVRLPDSSRFRAGQFIFWLEQGAIFDNLYYENDEICTGLFVDEDGDSFYVSSDGSFYQTEEGYCHTDIYRPRVDLRISRNGNNTYSNAVSRDLNNTAHFRNQIKWPNLGQANEMTIQLRFNGFQRFIANDGILEVY